MFAGTGFSAAWSVERSSSGKPHARVYRVCGRDGHFAGHHPGCETASNNLLLRPSHSTVPPCFPPFLFLLWVGRSLFVLWSEKNREWVLFDFVSPGLDLLGFSFISPLFSCFSSEGEGGRGCSLLLFLSVSEYRVIYTCHSQTRFQTSFYSENHEKHTTPPFPRISIQGNKLLPIGFTSVHLHEIEACGRPSGFLDIFGDFSPFFYIMPRSHTQRARQPRDDLISCKSQRFPKDVVQVL